MDVAQAQRVFPRAPVAWLIPLVAEMPKWGIETPNEEASFISQLGVESAGMTKFDENLDYRPERLVQVWPRRFYIPTAERPRDGTKRDAREYAHNPVRLADFIYGGRYGNGPEGSGDGWKYRGGGPIQLTFQANYAKAGVRVGYDLVADPNAVRSTPAIGVRVACSFWEGNGFDAIDDDDDVIAETRRVNGGEEGLKQRQQYFAVAKQVLGLAP